MHNNLLKPVQTTWKNPLFPPWKKSFRCPSSFVCRSGFLKLFAHVPLSIKYIISRHLIYAEKKNAIAQIRQWFAVFNGPNHFGARAQAKNSRFLKSEPELW